MIKRILHTEIEFEHQILVIFDQTYSSQCISQKGHASLQRLSSKKDFTLEKPVTLENY